MSARRLPAVALATIAGMSLLLFSCSGTGDDASRSDAEPADESAVTSVLQPTTPAAVDDVESSATEDTDLAPADADSEPAATETASAELEVDDELSAQDDSLPTPSKSAPAQYTRHVVEEAINRYVTDGRDATVEFYSSEESVDGAWYVFIVDEDAEVIAHPETSRVGLDVNGPVGTDVNGYVFGEQLLTATEDGKWVPYFYTRPEGGTLRGNLSFELKIAWTKRHDGLLFSSGWYIDVESYLPELIGEAAEQYRTGGLPAALEYYNDPDGIAAGLIPAVEYYNSTGILGGVFSGFIADSDGKILAHFDPTAIGSQIEDWLGPAVNKATAEGVWITAADNPEGSGGPPSMRIYGVDVDGTFIGGGWYELDSPG